MTPDQARVEVDRLEHHVSQPRELSGVELLVLAVGVGLAVVPSLPFLQDDGATFMRFHNWAIFVGGLLIGAVISRARTRLRR